MKIQKLVALFLLLCLLCAGCTEPQTDESAAVSEASSEVPIDPSPIPKPSEPLIFFLEPLYYYGEDDLLYIETEIYGETTFIYNPFYLQQVRGYYALDIWGHGGCEFPASFEMTPSVTATIMGHDYTSECYLYSSKDQYQHWIDTYHFSIREGDTYNSFNYDVKRQKVVGLRFWFDFPEEYEELTTEMDEEKLMERCLEAVKTQTGISDGWIESKANRDVGGGATKFLFSQYQHNVRVANVSVKTFDDGRIYMMDWSGVGDFPNVRVPDWEEEYYLNCAADGLTKAYNLHPKNELLEVKDFAIVPDSMYYLAIPEQRVDTVAFTVTYTTVQADGTEIERDALVALAYQPHTN